MKMNLQFMISVMLCMTSSTFALLVNDTICDVSYDPVPESSSKVADPLPPTWPVGSPDAYICGAQNKTSNSVDYSKCHTCVPTAIGKKCQLMANATAPVLESHKCNLAYGPVDIVDITKTQKYYCKDDQNYSCEQIVNPTVCDECTPAAYPPVKKGLL